MKLLRLTVKPEFVFAKLDSDLSALPELYQTSDYEPSEMVSIKDGRAPVTAYRHKKFISDFEEKMNDFGINMLVPECYLEEFGTVADIKGIYIYQENEESAYKQLFDAIAPFGSAEFLPLDILHTLVKHY